MCNSGCFVCSSVYSDLNGVSAVVIMCGVVGQESSRSDFLVVSSPDLIVTHI